MRWLAVAGLIFAGSFARAEVVVPTMTVRANTVLTPEHVSVKAGSVPGGVREVGLVVGMEARVVLYAGRPILRQDLVLPAVIKRNQLVPIVFTQAGLSISTIGRALDRGAKGDIIRVMNVSSRSTLFGTVLANGTVDVSGR